MIGQAAANGGRRDHSPPLLTLSPGRGEGTKPGRQRQATVARRITVHAHYEFPDAGLTPDRYAAIHRALLTGFLSGIAQRTDSGEYQAAGGMKSWLWPGSGLATKQPKWLVFAESVETTRRFLRTAARIDPAWIEPLAGNLVTRTYSDPHWEPDQLAVLAYEKVTLWDSSLFRGGGCGTCISSRKPVVNSFCSMHCWKGTGRSRRSFWPTI